MGKSTKKKNKVKVTNKGYMKIKSSHNNTIVTAVNLQNQVIAWSSCGRVGFKGSKQSTPFATKTAARDCADQAFKLGLREIEVHIKGKGTHQEVAIRPFIETDLKITAIRNLTSEAFGGCRPPKKRNL